MTTQLTQPETTRAHHDNVDPAAPGPYQRTAFTSRVTAAGLGAAVHRWLDRHSITLLRISMGAVIFGFGILKYFPGVSPAENLILTTTHLLTFGMVPSRVAMVLLATVECAIGLSLITSRGLRATIYLLVMWVLGILSPAVLLPGRLFSGPDHAPTLEGQYVLKDIILLTASLVIVAATLQRAKADTHPPPRGTPHSAGSAGLSAPRLPR
ncbi:MAG: hypothetical protein ACRDRR_01270 [Pseudonocardiaceae bacterium]